MREALALVVLLFPLAALLVWGVGWGVLGLCAAVVLATVGWVYLIVYLFPDV